MAFLQLLVGDLQGGLSVNPPGFAFVNPCLPFCRGKGKAAELQAESVGWRPAKTRYPSHSWKTGQRGVRRRPPGAGGVRTVPRTDPAPCREHGEVA